MSTPMTNDATDTLPPSAQPASSVGVDIDHIDSSAKLMLSGPLANGEFVLLQSIVYDIGKGTTNLTIHVPKGFRTDFSSIPWYAQWLLPKFGPHNLAAILHDYLYETRALGFEVANAIFYEVLRSTPNVPKWKAVLMAVAVQLRGKQRYNT